MLHCVDSDKPLDRICEALPQACADHQFGVLVVFDLKQKLNEKGVAFDRECRVYEICNPRMAQRALQAEPAIATALPCRIAVYPIEGGKTRLATIRPTALAEAFDWPGVRDVAREVERTLMAIMDDAAN